MGRSARKKGRHKVKLTLPAYLAFVTFFMVACATATDKTFILPEMADESNSCLLSENILVDDFNIRIYLPKTEEHCTANWDKFI